MYVMDYQMLALYLLLFALISCGCYVVATRPLREPLRVRTPPAGGRPQGRGRRGLAGG